jgi:hypothetical protein
MTRYLISFDDGAMTFPEEETPAVGEAAHQVVRRQGPSEARLLETFQLQTLAFVGMELPAVPHDSGPAPNSWPVDSPPSTP